MSGCKASARSWSGRALSGAQEWPAPLPKRAWASSPPLGTLSRDLHAGLATIRRVMSGYLLALALVLPLNGWLVDRIGAKAVCLWCFAAFTQSSTLRGLAWSAGSLIAFRVLQGMSGGLLAPMAQMMVARVAGRQMPRVASYVTLPALLAPLLRPVVAIMRPDAGCSLSTSRSGGGVRAGRRPAERRPERDAAARARLGGALPSVAATGAVPLRFGPSGRADRPGLARHLRRRARVVLPGRVAQRGRGPERPSTAPEQVLRRVDRCRGSRL